MDLVLVRFTCTAEAGLTDLAPEVLADIVWANATGDERLEHVRARYAPTPDAIDLALFHRSGPGADNSARAIDLCRRATARAPALRGWAADLIPPRPR